MPPTSFTIPLLIGLKKTPLEFVWLGTHHIQAGSGSQNADVAIDPSIPLYTDGCGDECKS